MGTYLVPVNEGYGRGAVPGLHEKGLILEEGFDIFRKLRYVFPCGRYQHVYGVLGGKAHVAQELEDPVEGGRITLLVRDQRLYEILLIPQDLVLELVLEGDHPVPVALYCVYLTVVGKESEGLGEPPVGECVGRVPLVEHAVGGLEVGIFKVRVEPVQLGRHEHSLVYDRLRRKRWNVYFLITEPVFYPPPYEVKLYLPLLGRDSLHVQKELFYPRHHLQGGLPYRVRIRGDFPPSEDLHTLFNELRYNLILHLLVEEEDPNGEVLYVRDLISELIYDPPEELPRYLGQDTCTVPRLSVSSYGSPVGQVLYRLHPPSYYLITNPTLYVADEADTAGIELCPHSNHLASLLRKYI